MTIPTSQPPTLKERSEVAEEDKWNVESLYLSLDHWNEDYQALSKKDGPARWPELAKYKQRLNEGPNILNQALDLFFSINQKLEKLATYAHLRHDEDTTYEKAKIANQKATSLIYDFYEEISWIEPEILSFSEQKLKDYLHSPVLSNYKFYLEKLIRLKPYTLDEEKEALLAMAGKPLDTPPKAFSALNNADIKFGTILDGKGAERPLSHGLYSLYLRDPDRTLRKNAFKAYHNKYLDLENSLCELLYGHIQGLLFNAKARKYNSCLEASLYPKNIPLEVYHQLIKTVRAHLPSLHRYIKLRKQILNVETLHPYDLYVPLVPKVDMQFDYLKGEGLVIESSRHLGAEYQSLLKEGLKEKRWVDRFENKNKRSGAYSSGCYDSFPYILMNYRGLLNDVFTLAHEAGHSMHSLLTRLTQPYQYANYPIFVAEVASTFNEELLMELLMERTAKKEDKLFLVNEKIEDIRSTFFRQTMFAEFELKMCTLVEEGTPLTPQLLKDEYLKLNQEYFGSHLTIDSELAIEWARIPHFYYNFYVYQYATGISAALALSEKILTAAPSEKPSIQNAYLSFLKGGSSDYPIQLLKKAGVDMTSPAPIEATLHIFDTLLNQLEKLA